MKISAIREGDVVKYHIIVDIQCLFRAEILHKFLTSHASIYTPPGCCMPLMADGEWLTLGRVPSREREKDEERERELKSRKRKLKSWNKEVRLAIQIEPVYSTQSIGK